MSPVAAAAADDDDEALFQPTVECLRRADKPRSLDPKDPRTPALADITSADFVLFIPLTGGRQTRADLSSAQLTSSLDRVVDGASRVTITVLDDNIGLLNGPMLRPVKTPDTQETRFYARTILDGLELHLVGVKYDPRRIDLTFEEQAANDLRRFDNPLSVSRNKSTRGQFVKRLCDEARVPLICPELDVRQKIAGLSAKERAAKAKTDAKADTATRDKARKAGFPDHATIVVKGEPASTAQRENLAVALGVASSLGGGVLATQAMVCAGTGESGFKVVKNPSSVYSGVFQADPKNIPADDTAEQARCFLQGGKGFQGGGAIALARAHPDWTPGHIAYVVEGDLSNFGGDTSKAAHFYDVYLDEARRTIASYTGGDLGDTSGVLSGDADEYTVEYDFQRGKDGERETSWDCCRRLADEVGWYFFVSGGYAYFVSGNYLKRSRSRMLVRPGAEGVETVSFTLDESPRYDDTVTVTCRARRWQAPPGSMVDVEGYGPADDRWLVARIQRAKLASSDLTTVTLARPKRKKNEPHSETRQRANQLDGEGGLGTPTGAAGGTRARVLTVAKLAVAKSSDDPSYYFYSQPGKWKDDPLERDRGGDRSDCSSFVIQVYAEALGGYAQLPAALRRQGYTGTLAAVGRKTNNPQPGDICLYGVGPAYHHVELFIGGGKHVDYSTPSGSAGYWTFDFLEKTAASTPDPPQVQSSRTASDGEGGLRPT